MGRPRMSRQEKLARLRLRFLGNIVRYGNLDKTVCWTHMDDVQREYVCDGARMSPRTVSWVIHFPDRGLPEPRHIYWIGNKKSCTVAECCNPEHLEIKANEPKRQPYSEPIPIYDESGVVRGDAPDGAIWNPDKPYQLLWQDLDKWAEWQRGRGMSEEMIEDKLARGRARSARE